jgi:DNA-directed RNA polymerase subunit RPC12/RpoP
VIGAFQRRRFLGNTGVRIGDAYMKEGVVVIAMYFECAECEEQFALPEIQVRAHTRPLSCPACGSVDLEWMGVGPSALLADADIQAA